MIQSNIILYFFTSLSISVVSIIVELSTTMSRAVLVALMLTELLVLSIVKVVKGPNSTVVVAESVTVLSLSIKNYQIILI